MRRMKERLTNFWMLAFCFSFAGGAESALAADFCVGKTVGSRYPNEDPAVCDKYYRCEVSGTITTSNSGPGTYFKCNESPVTDHIQNVPCPRTVINCPQFSDVLAYVAALAQPSTTQVPFSGFLECEAFGSTAQPSDIGELTDSLTVACLESSPTIRIGGALSLRLALPLSVGSQPETVVQATANSSVVFRTRTSGGPSQPERDSADWFGEFRFCVRVDASRWSCRFAFGQRHLFVDLADGTDVTSLTIT